MKLYFQNSQGKERLIATVKTEKQVMKEINKFCDERGYKPPYFRTWFDNDGRKWIDCGSWSEFFVVDGIKEQE